MRTNKLVICACGTSIFALMAAAPGFAQGETANTATSYARDTITVTARKKEENAQDVPIALDVAGGKEIDDRSVRDVVDIQQFAPALRVAPAALNPTGVYFTSRALVVTDTRLTTDPAVGLYIDGINIPRTIGITASEFFDVSRIEVLKGPQGTLFGKNNTGGAIQYFSNLPTHEFEGKIQTRAATGGEVSVAAAVNIPVSETFALRLASVVTNRDGFGNDTITGDDYGALNSKYFRATSLWEPTDRLTVTIRGDFTDAYASQTAYKGGDTLTGPAISEVAVELGLVAPADLAAVLGDPVLGPPIVAQAIAAYTGYQDGDPQDGASTFLSDEDIQHWGVSATLDYELTDNVSLKSITSWRELESFGKTDVDGSPFQLLSFPGHEFDVRNLTQEIQLSGLSFNDRLSWIGGFYYANEKGGEILQQQSLGVLSAARGNTFQDGDVQNKSWALFAQGTVEILPTLSITGGARYTKDTRKLTTRNHDNINCNALGVSLASLMGAPCEYVVPSTKFDAWSYTASIEWRPIDDVMLYGRYDRGYRTGGLPFTGGNALSPEAAAASFEPFFPEFAKSWEAGAKTQFFDGRVLMNLSYYNVDYSDLQRGSSKIVPGTMPPQIINFVSNAASANVQGVEGLLSLRPIQGLDISGSVSYVHPEYDTYIDVGSGADRSGESFVDVSKWTYTISGSYEIPVSFGNLGLRADYYWQDDAVTSVPAGVRPSYEVLNIRANAYLEDADMTIAIFGKNVTNDEVGMFSLDLIGSLGIRTNGPTTRPRQWGVELSKSF